MASRPHHIDGQNRYDITIRSRGSANGHALPIYSTGAERMLARGNKLPPSPGRSASRDFVSFEPSGAGSKPDPSGHIRIPFGKFANAGVNGPITNLSMRVALWT
jgi:hypothetical protein